MEKYARYRYQPCLPLGVGGRPATASPEHIALSRRAAGEGMVLLKNEAGALPLRRGEKIALFGKATIEYIKGGGGSGDVYTPYVRSIYEGFAEKEAQGKVQIYMPAVDFYRSYVKAESKNVLTPEQIDARWDIVNNMPFCQERDDLTYDTFAAMHVREPAVDKALIADAAAWADTAVVTISRFSAEGVDRRPIPGDWYLSDIERDLLSGAAEAFSKVVVVLDSGAPVDCEFFAEDPRIQGVLFGWQGGIEGGGAIADILCGDVNPSGKLVDTIARSYDDYPVTEAFTESFNYVNYLEDVYVGYRYFETLPGMRERVRYPFGFGLSYTDFALCGTVVCPSGDGLVAVTTVRNVGDRPGRETVQVYCAAPQGLLGKPARVLAAYRKTRLLAPGESETLAMAFDRAALASFDDLGRIQKSAFVLEKGVYEFFVGTDVRSAQKTDFALELADDVVVEQLHDYCRPWKLPRRLRPDGSYEPMPTGEAAYRFGKNEPLTAPAPEKLTLFDDVGETISLDSFIAQFTDDELTDFVGGKPPTGVANTGCFGGMARLGVPPIPTADGPAGVRLEPKVGISTTCWPCATLMACTWDPELIFEVGAAGGRELYENNIGIWLAPAMNIHRNPLCGRNFEYYAEDPLVAGKSAAAAIRGVQSSHAAVSLKHFACNNKEANRFASDSRLSERALREIYLRGFEIAVKEGDPITIMSSYNLINGQHTSESWELLTGILRTEWGFRGMVATDWGVKNDPVTEVLAGNDLKMPVGYPADLKKGLEDGRLTRADLEVCVRRILEMTLRMA